MDIFGSTLESISYSYATAELKISVDDAASRILGLDRNNNNVIFGFGSNQPLGVVTCRLPMQYATSSDILVIMIDDNRQFNAKAIDGVKCAIVQSSFDVV